MSDGEAPMPEEPALPQGESGDGSDDGSDDGATQPVVSRSKVREARDEAHRKRLLIWGGATAAVVVVIAVVGVWLSARGGKDEPVVRTTTTTTTSTTTTTVPVTPSAVMPLTGVPVDGNDPAVAARLMTPALAVKIDNDPKAQPQEGIQDADLVIELRVEGISRYMAVFHSLTPDRIGPVRSARTSDPDLLAMFGKPVFAWSGGNKRVMDVIGSTPWVVDASHSARGSNYVREKSRRAPHNLMLLAPQLLKDTASSGLPPHQLFDYLGAGEEPTGQAVSGLDVLVGSTLASFRWDPQAAKWIRHGPSGPQKAANGAPVGANNVIVARTDYRPSAADRRSPEAQSLGDGDAWVFTKGQMIVGRWSRQNREQGWALVDGEGRPIKLSPGSSWICLPDPSKEPRIIN